MILPKKGFHGYPQIRLIIAMGSNLSSANEQKVSNHGKQARVFVDGGYDLGSQLVIMNTNPNVIFLLEMEFLESAPL